jgi:hypothetical protein
MGGTGGAVSGLDAWISSPVKIETRNFASSWISGRFAPFAGHVESMRCCSA